MQWLATSLDSPEEFAAAFDTGRKGIVPGSDPPPSAIS